MKRTEAENIGDILRTIFDDSLYRASMTEARAAEVWKTVLGEKLAACTGRPSLKNGVMTVAVPNASLRHELWISRSRLIDLLNKSLGRDTVKDIRLI